MLIELLLLKSIFTVAYCYDFHIGSTNKEKLMLALQSNTMEGITMEGILWPVFILLCFHPGFNEKIREVSFYTCRFR